MIKSLSVISVMLAAGLLIGSQASAKPSKLSFNGRNLNGVSENGRNLNGILLNGRNLNGRNLNGRNLNGAARAGTIAGQGVQATAVILKDGARVTLR
jgi:uncharacterized protein YjbI with pentapeptide repeats